MVNTNPTAVNNAKDNVAIGYQAGRNNTTGTYITLVGSETEVLGGSLTNAAAIGANAEVRTSDAMVLGRVTGVNGATTTVKVGVGTPLPQNRLDDSGSLGLGIRLTTVSVTLGIDDHTIIIPNSVGAGTVTLTLPAANTCTRREYVIVNQNVTTAKTFSINYLDFTGTAVNTIPANGSITIQSNGTNWYRIR
ncbi:MAG: hypothetical protein U0U67_14820 [Chitinophagales bacterium]